MWFRLIPLNSTPSLSPQSTTRPTLPMRPGSWPIPAQFCVTWYSLSRKCSSLSTALPPGCPGSSPSPSSSSWVSIATCRRTLVWVRARGLRVPLERARLRRRSVPRSGVAGEWYGLAKTYGFAGSTPTSCRVCRRSSRQGSQWGGRMRGWTRPRLPWTPTLGRWGSTRRSKGDREASNGVSAGGAPGGTGTGHWGVMRARYSVMDSLETSHSRRRLYRMRRARLEWQRRRHASADCSCRDRDKKAECCSRRRYSTREDKDERRGNKWWRPELLKKEMAAS